MTTKNTRSKAKTKRTHVRSAVKRTSAAENSRATRDTVARVEPTPAAQAAAFDAEILERAKRIGIPPEEVVRQDRERKVRKELVGEIGPDLVLACDQLGEEIAAYRCEGAGSEYQNVIDALYTLWQIRWHLGMSPKKAAQEIEHVAGGAS